MKRAQILWTAIAILAGAASAASAQAIYSENFNSGSAPGWIFGGNFVGSPTSAPTVSFVNGGIRFSGPKPPNAVVGPQEVNAGPTTIAPADFITSIDIVNWNDNERQWLGVLGRIVIDDTGAISTGYQASIVTRRRANANVSTLNLLRYDPTATVDIAQFVEIPAISVTDDFRVTMSAIGTSITATFQNLTTGQVLGTLSANGATAVPYTGGGLTGITAYSNGPLYGIDATFDNFAVVPEPATLGLLAPLAGLLVVRRR